uniref:Large ribosomal subunit protein mL53 n=1 Tax=Cyprinus carpio carpio TaxID=630221 RepID=A0A9J8BGX3_CYPCA
MAGIPVETEARATLLIFCVRRDGQHSCLSEGEFLIMVGSEKARATNMNCEVITEVKHDRSQPMIDITFLDGERLVMKGSRITTQEMLSALQTRCSAKHPQAKAGDKK